MIAQYRSTDANANHIIVNDELFSGSVPCEIYRLTKTRGLANLMFHITPKTSGNLPLRSLICSNIPHPIIARDYYISINQADGNNLHAIVSVVKNTIETYYSYNPVTNSRGQGLIIYLCNWDWGA